MLKRNDDFDISNTLFYFCVYIFHNTFLMKGEYFYFRGYRDLRTFDKYIPKEELGYMLLVNLFYNVPKLALFKINYFRVQRSLFIAQTNNLH